MAARVHRPLKVKALKANDICRERHELSKQLQDFRCGSALRDTSHIITFIGLTASREERAFPTTM
jgi:hypothetical protein